ncbi:CaiB/BaiF CoA transferase family protein [Rhodococcus opacus]|uniref:CaiB/BaiF CoA transferase family protein n=1 Tax=Rhodococcus opacus TaxID=37919 RepID=UPI002476E80D|nr:CoA transferase [Rhodococcus opacus]MDH6293306.1 crotonobetainyl-CoA:carnitine CoA-transferase CaiB-like acyl-CoA transferase [Rhodococcus opacus]
MIDGNLITHDGPGGPASDLTNLLPLDGVRVVDLTHVAAGPYGTSLLGDFGADVVKVEPPSGDSMRDVDAGFGPHESSYFFGVNRSKRSLVLDLKNKDSRGVLERLVADADVLAVAYRPDALRRMGLDYETLRKINPRLIYVSITAFGEDGPRAHQPGMDILAQALSGLMGVTGEDGRAPVKVGAPVGDFIGSFLFGLGVCAALRLRDKTGVGDHISINLLDGLVSVFANIITPFDTTRKPVRRLGGGHPQLVPYQPFVDSEGKYFILACLNDKFWHNLLPLLDEYGDFRIPEYELNEGRVEQRDKLCADLQKIFVQQRSSDWLAKLEEAGVPCGPIHDLADMLEEPQIIANQSVIHLTHPKHGEYLVPNNPIRFENAPTGPRGYAPGLGEHTREILKESGYSAEEVEDLISNGVVSSIERTADVAPSATALSST